MFDKILFTAGLCSFGVSVLTVVWDCMTVFKHPHPYSLFGGLGGVFITVLIYLIKGLWEDD